MTSINPTLKPWSLSSDLEGEFETCGVSSGENKYPITEKELMDRWRIRKEEATATVLATTQRLFKSILEPTLNRRYKTNDRMLQYFRIQTDKFVDTYFASKKLGPSMRGFIGSQLFVTYFGWCKVEPMELQSELLLVLKSVFKEDGVPEKMICDGAPEQVSVEAARLCQLADRTVQWFERGTPWSNRSEVHVDILKGKILLDLK